MNLSPEGGIQFSRQHLPHNSNVSLSAEDRQFLEDVENTIHKNCHSNWEIPLPFKSGKANWPNNRPTAMNRLNGLLHILKCKPQMKSELYLEFMGKLLERRHAEIIPQETSLNTQKSGSCHIFGVYHPKKPNQIRVVFDPSAEHQGISLNKELLAKPDIMNGFLGVLLRFCQDHACRLLC